MKHIVPLIILIAAAVGLIAAAAALCMIVAVQSVGIIAPVAVFVWALASTLSAVPFVLSWIFIKSKLCRAAAAIAGLGIILEIAGIIILL